MVGGPNEWQTDCLTSQIACQTDKRKDGRYIDKEKEPGDTSKQNKKVTPQPRRMLKKEKGHNPAKGKPNPGY